MFPYSLCFSIFNRFPISWQLIFPIASMTMISLLNTPSIFLILKIFSNARLCLNVGSKLRPYLCLLWKRSLIVAYMFFVLPTDCSHNIANLSRQSLCFCVITQRLRSLSYEHWRRILVSFCFGFVGLTPMSRTISREANRFSRLCNFIIGGIDLVFLFFLAML